MERVHGKTPPKDLRRTMAAIFWRHQNGTKWRSLPEAFSPWWLAAQLFIRWAHFGVWERLLELAQKRGVELGMVFIDGTTIRAHHKRQAPKKGADSAERDHREALGRSRGGFGTKAVVTADAAGRAIGFALAPGQAHELPLAPGLIETLPDIPLWVVGDRGFSADDFRALLWDIGTQPVIPPKETRLRSSARISSTSIETASSGCGTGSRSGVPSPPDTRKPPPPSSAYSASQQQQIGSRSNRT